MEDLPGGSTAASAPQDMQSRTCVPLPAAPRPSPGTPCGGSPERPTEANPLMPEEYTAIAQRLTGIAGWICGACRFGAYLAFVDRRRPARLHQLDQGVSNAIVRWCSYLVDSRDVRLSCYPVGQTTPFDVGADSFCLNGPLPVDYGDCPGNQLSNRNPRGISHRFPSCIPPPNPPPV